MRLRGGLLASVSAELGGEFPLLVKLLFPADKLSVQVHPDDAWHRRWVRSVGRRSAGMCWRLEPEAAVALGLKDGVSVADVERSVADGTMEALLKWVPVSVGDTLFVDAGTVHAIGPGVVLLETQQTSDVTYRLYDYGRPRELHLEKGLKVIKPKTAAGKVAPRVMNGFTRLIEQKYFVVDRFDAVAGDVRVVMDGSGCLVALAGSGVVRSGADEVQLKTAQAVVVPSGTSAVTIESDAGVSFMRCVAPVS